ncbi:hypothetical protein SAMN05443637_12927 [Pseudonocardia thermophila]|jgi:hypothetical protein|uniref:Uncharacterized protein n=1 Tax=Pseudonocardia thermophila TaxID=1848 RepID=A0A1M7APF5_PSETH|nr:IniB N-terminal domain-containing protein [Pseudonocardia thermophila]SHL44620.1 hypothetical protein SAMN05443637_12927 [Pseudonocardia thermophila]
MAEPLSLLEFVQRLAGDDDLRADFAADPHGVLADHGLDGLAPEDVRDALMLVEDTRTVEYRPDHVTEPGPDLDPAAGPDAVVRWFADYAGLPTEPAPLTVDVADDIDDLDLPPAGRGEFDPLADEVDDFSGYSAGSPYDDGFGHGVGPGLPGADEFDPVLADPDAPVADPVFDEPFDEFDAEPHTELDTAPDTEAEPNGFTPADDLGPHA